jgi:Zn-dependent peptidase ImmA (M78 family)/DNA-binding XRE family transcriptional regulator
MSGFGDAITVTRKARDITQAELADKVGVSQAAINRYEAGLRDPDDETLGKIADVLGVTRRFLRDSDRFVGALAVDAHMRRQKTTKASVWRRLEAELNLLRLHSSLLFSEVSIAAEQMVPTFDPLDTTPEAAARLVRAQWRLPIGPVVNLTRRLEAAGCLVFTTDFGTSRVDGLSQWSGDHPVILLNEALAADRLRLTLAHELGHLCLHTMDPTEDMEGEANRFAAEFLMPEEAIRHQLRRPEIGTLLDLKREWGVSMQALYERAYRLGLVTGEERQRFYRMLNARGWKTVEPHPERVLREKPELAAHIGTVLHQRGLGADEINELVGVVDSESNPFRYAIRTLHAV